MSELESAAHKQGLSSVEEVTAARFPLMSPIGSCQNPRPMPVSPTRIPRDRIAAAALIALLSAVPAGAQDNPVQPVVHGHLATPDVYVVQAGPGDLVSVTLERQGEPATGTVAVNGDKGLTLRKEYFFADDPAPLTFEFVAPRDGAYRIRIQPSGHSNGTYTLRSMVRTPQQQVAGVVPVTPIIRDESTRIRKLTREIGRAHV